VGRSCWLFWQKIYCCTCSWIRSFFRSRKRKW